MSSPFEFKPLWLYLWSWSCQGPGLSQIWIRIRNRIFRRRQDNGFPPQNKKKKKERKIEKPSLRSSEKLLVETVGRQIMHAVAALRFSLSASFLLFGKL